MGRFFCEFWLFSCENHPKSPDCSANLDFFPAQIPRICPWKSREMLLFFPAKYQKPWLFLEESSMKEWVIFPYLFLRLSFCKLILKYSRESESSFNIGEGNVLHFRIWEISRLLSNNICWRDSWVWDFIVEFNKIAALQIKHTQQQSCWGICSLKCPFLQWFSIRGRISSVGRALDCRAGGHGFGSRARTNTQGLKITE